MNCDCAYSYRLIENVRTATRLCEGIHSMQLLKEFEEDYQQRKVMN
jgi:hypothetical protein